MIVTTADPETAIMTCVRNFCDQARNHAIFVPVFAAKVHDCEVHHHVASNFSSHFPLGTARCGGRPYRLHAGLPIEPEHFDRLLALVAAAIKQHLPPMLPPRRPPGPRCRWRRVSALESLASWRRKACTRIPATAPAGMPAKGGRAHRRREWRRPRQPHKHSREHYEVLIL
jgi:truncated hemoglobin YjbI